MSANDDQGRDAAARSLSIARLFDAPRSVVYEVAGTSGTSSAAPAR